MENKGNFFRFILIIFLLAAPAVSIRLYSNYYNASHLQPLALTRESLGVGKRGRQGEGLARIDVQIRWGRDWTGSMTRSRLRDVISASLKHQTEYYYIDFHERSGAQVDITFIVGSNTYGPFPSNRFVSGLKSALVAQKMTNGPEG